jgi:protein-tyrosine phosphatase
LIDIHCHLLPDIDDGPDSWEESLELAKLLTDEGVEIAITTPHWIKGSSWQPESGHVVDLVHQLNLKLREKDIPLSVLPGMEVGINEKLPELVSSREILTLGGGKYILVETPYVSIPFGIKEIIFRLKVSGFEPILAHPERCSEIQANPKTLKDIVDDGASAQVTTSSFLGYFGRGARECAIKLAKEGLIHFLASDAHSPDKRPPEIKKALTMLGDIIGRAEAKTIEDRAGQIIP